MAHFGPSFPILGAKKILTENPALSRTTSHGILAPCQISEKTNDTIPRKSLGRRRTEGQTDRRMNRPYFIGPFGLLGRSPTSIYQITLRRLCSQILSFYFSSFISKDNHVLVEKHNPLEKSYDSQERTRWY